MAEAETETGIFIYGIVVYGITGVILLCTIIWNYCAADTEKQEKLGTLAVNVRRIFRFCITLFICGKLNFKILSFVL
jgi:hypothetical protein